MDTSLIYIIRTTTLAAEKASKACLFSLPHNKDVNN